MSNMFRCTLASGGALVLTVTCDSAFAGQTITCTDGTTTLTQICPSTSPYTVEFKIPNGGTWAISSGTASISVTIPDSAELHIIPNGSTITPTGDIQIWLHCANIWNKSYTTITQVLNDVSTLQALIASNNAADYMARSTNWASSVCANGNAMTYIGTNNYCANKLLANSTWLNAICNSAYFESVLNVKVPTMTSNTTPSGIASASREEWYAYYAFNGNSNDRWVSGQGFQNDYVGYEFTNDVTIYAFKATFTSAVASVSYKIQAYINNVWTDISGNITSMTGDRRKTTNISKAKKFRLYINSQTLSGASYYGNVNILQFYGRTAS